MICGKCVQIFQSAINDFRKWEVCPSKPSLVSVWQVVPTGIMNSSLNYKELLILTVGMPESEIDMERI